LETIDELQAFLADATRDGVWGRLLDRGAAWAIMRQDGELPIDAPPLGDTIDTDLAEYGFSVLRASLALREAGGSTDIAQRAFEKAANAFEALVRNGSPEALERDFYRVLAGAAYHLAGYSAIAYSLFNQINVGTNATPGEVALIRLILRDLDGLRLYTREWLREESHSDQALAVQLETDGVEADDVIATILNSGICRSLSYFDFALQTGEVLLLESARAILAGTVKLAADAGAVSSWWVARLCLNLIDDLWDHSLHVNLPLTSPQGGEADYQVLRRMFLISLYGRRCAEVELWPSQREAARRSSDVTDDLVVSLPTSAGKTRVAEIAALMTLSARKRVLLVTPLRALSAQTERSFRKTFGVLGFTVSSLYGASGVSADDEDTLRSRNIIIATPEKLDFALRSDPTLIDDVGLIVFDEGHLIGPSEREIRYEALVQRLLRRVDSASRRIVCLSAILPDGEQLNDLTGWIRHDAPGEAVRSSWRPTRQRFGTLVWRSKSARLNFDLDVQGPFIGRFIEEISPRGSQKKPFPREVKDLSLFAAWNFAAQDKRTLIFCTQANWVEGYGTTALDLVERGYLPSLLDRPEAINRALEVGREWLGNGHPAVESLKIGLAIHHGGLPNPFLRELEVLLAEGILKVIVASPTLSQGLNLNAAVLLVPSLYRSGTMISGEEFANVAGRAGRAFVDIEGLIVHVMYNPEPWRITQWQSLVASARARALKSGLIQIVWEVMQRLAIGGVLQRSDAIEYLANSREAWVAAADEGAGDETVPLSHLVERLDAAVFSLIEALDADNADLPRLLDEALQGSLWARQIVREPQEWQPWYRAVLGARTRVIWNHTTPASRRGHFAMGVGLDAGLALDSMADELGHYIDIADLAALRGEGNELADALTELGRRLLVMRPFVPDKKNVLPPHWPQILKAWVTGVDVNVIGTDNMAMVEDAFSYRLVWALEAVRTRRMTLGWSPDIVGGTGAASLETGVPHYAMAMLIRAGLPSRIAAITAVRETRAMFFDNPGMRGWLASNQIAAFTSTGEWPTPETAALWQRFREDFLSGGIQKWKHQADWCSLSDDFSAPAPGIYRVEVEDRTGIVWLCSADHQRLTRFESRLRDIQPSFFSARIVGGDARAYVERFGRDSAWLDD
jgi:DEAD/DEAH box helicase